MNAYKVIGNDGREYGPADLATIRAWVTEGRIAPGTLIQAAGTTERKAASAFPELGVSAPASSPPPQPWATTSPGSTRPTPSAKPRPETARLAPWRRVLWVVSVLIVAWIVLVVVARVWRATEEESRVALLSRPLDPPLPPARGSATVPAQSARSPEEQRERQAAEQGDAEAQHRLGRLYAKRMGVRQDYAEAAGWYRKAAEQGHTQAQYELGRLYAQGLGVPRSNAEAARWYRRAAENGYAPAQHLLGHLYASGQGLETVYLEAPEPPPKEQQGASPGQPGSPSDYAEAARWWHKAADQGDADAQSDLGWLYTYGRGVETNYIEAARWYRKSAEQGNPVAQHWLGHVYLSGSGVDKDEVEAFKWFLQAAQKGNVYAQGDVGRLYATGRGVEQDSVEAIKWYRKAADAGLPSAQNTFAWMLATSTNASVRNGALALEFAQKAVAATRRTNASFLDTLAAAHAEAGDLEQAAAIQKEAIALLRDPNSEPDYASRLKLYEAKTPYREEPK